MSVYSFCAFYFLSVRTDAVSIATKIVAIRSPGCSPRSIGVFTPHTSRIRNPRSKPALGIASITLAHRGLPFFSRAPRWPSYLDHGTPEFLAIIPPRAQHESKYRSRFSLSHSSRRVAVNFLRSRRCRKKRRGPAFLPGGLNESGRVKTIIESRVVSGGAPISRWTRN